MKSKTGSSPITRVYTGPHGSTMIMTTGSTQIPKDDIWEKKRGIRQCKTCWWYEPNVNWPGSGGCYFVTPPKMGAARVETVRENQWCSCWEPAKQTILSHRWQELIDGKRGTEE